MLPGAPDNRLVVADFFLEEKEFFFNLKVLSAKFASRFWFKDSVRRFGFEDSELLVA